MTTTVTRMHRPHSHYTQISNEFLRAEIPPYSFRVACFILSHEAGYVLTQERIGKATGMTRKTVAGALTNLRELGYLAAVEVRDSQGHVAGTKLFVSDVGFTEEEIASLCVPSTHRDEPANVYQIPTPMGSKYPSECVADTQHKKTKEKTNLEDNNNLPATPGTGQALAEIERRDVDELCSLLRDRMIANGCRPPSITKAWQDAARLLLDRDGISFNEARAGILWCTQDQFWSSNILSMPTYRKQFDKLKLSARREQAEKQPQRSTVDEKVQGWVDLPKDPGYIPPWRRSAE